MRIPVIHTYHASRNIADIVLILGMIGMNDWNPQLTSNPHSQKAEKRIIPTGIDLAKFDRPEITPKETAALREKYEVAEDETLLLSLSRVSYEKNIQAVIAALPDVLKVNPKVKLIVAGDGPYLDDLKKQAAKLGISDAVVSVGVISGRSNLAKSIPVGIMRFSALTLYFWSKS